MRAFIFILALSAWIATCLDTVSYLRAHENERMAQVEERKADDTLAGQIAQNETDNEPLRDKLSRDQQLVDAERSAVASARQHGRNGSREQQVLDSANAMLRADRNLAFTNEAQVHTGNDPAIGAARENLEVYDAAVSRAQEFELRDAKFGQVIAGLWVGVIVLSLFNARSRTQIRALRVENHSA